MRHALIALSILLGTITPGMAQVSVTVSIPGVSIGVHQPVYPELELVPGYPVYYAPNVQANYFFYDGLYWVYQDDRWYMSSWYNGPWDLVEPDDVPLFVLRVPVRYYAVPPVYFHGWLLNAPPRWELYWGPRWTRYHHGWDRWDRRVVYAPAPLPVYQRHYHGDRYPRQDYQRVIRHEHYHYQPRDHVVRERHHDRTPSRQQAHAHPGVQHRPAQHSPDFQREQRPHREREELRRGEPLQVLPQQRAQPRQDMERRAQSEPHNRPDFQREHRQHRDREETRRSEPLQVLPQQRAPVAQEQRPQPPQSRDERRAEPQSRPDVSRVPPQREELRKPEGMQVLPHQRAAVLQERQHERQQQQQQQQQRQEATRLQPAPLPQQAQERGAQDRGDRHQRRDNPGRQGQERGGDRGPGRG